MTTTLQAAEAIKGAWAAICDQVVALGPCTMEDLQRVAKGFAEVSDQSPATMIRKFKAIYWCLHSVKLKPDAVKKLGQFKTLSSYQKRNEGQGPAFEGRKAWTKMYPASQHELLNAVLERVCAVAGITNNEEQCDFLIALLVGLTPQQIQHFAQTRQT